MAATFPHAKTIAIILTTIVIAISTVACGFLGSSESSAPLPTLPLTTEQPTTPTGQQPAPTEPQSPEQPTNMPSESAQPPNPATPAPDPTPTPTPLPTSTPPPPVVQADIPLSPPVSANICDRTPEVQASIITALDDVGPELPCRRIYPDEMFRLRTLSVSSPVLTSKDLTEMPNLQTLDLTTRVNRLRDITPGTFSGMTRLKTLRLNLSHPNIVPPPVHTEQFNSNLFKHTPGLAHLTIAIAPQSPSVLLTKETFRGIDNLATLEINHLHALDPDALDLLKGLRSVTLTGQHALEATRQQTLPPDLFKNQLFLQNVTVSGLQFPAAITMASFEAACHAFTWAPKDTNGEPIPQIFVDRQKVDLIKPGEQDRQDSCLLRVGDNRLIEVPR